MIGDVTLLGDSVLVGEQRYKLPHPADDAFILGDFLVVLYAPSSESGEVGQFPNLVAFNDEGKLVWTAALPTTETGDCYYRVVSHQPLVANSVRSFSMHYRS